MNKYGKIIHIGINLALYIHLCVLYKRSIFTANLERKELCMKRKYLLR